MNNDVLNGLASNGPWAAVAAFLLWKVIDAWAGDRKQLTELLNTFKGTLDGLKVAVDHLTDELKGKKDA